MIIMQGDNMSVFFERIEKKHILSYDQYQLLKEIIEQRLFEDEHGESTILNIYFDTDNYDIISHIFCSSLYNVYFSSNSIS